MSDVLLDIPSHQRDRLASALESGVLGTSPSIASLRSVLGHGENVEDIAVSLRELGRLGISGVAAATWLRTIERALGRSRKPDFVWSGPEVPGLHARDTRRVYEELLGSAQRSIWACTYAFFDGPKTFEVVAHGSGTRAPCHIIAKYSTQAGRLYRSGSIGTEVCGSLLEKRVARDVPAKRFL
jgi:hypothetical protein